MTDDGKFYALKIMAIRGGTHFSAIRHGTAHSSDKPLDFVLVPEPTEPESQPAPTPTGRRHAAPREKLRVIKVASASKEELELAKPLGPMCLSSDGSVVALCVRNSCRVVVVSVSALTILNQFFPEWEPKAVCMVSEVLTVISAICCRVYGFEARV